MIQNNLSFRWLWSVGLLLTAFSPIHASTVFDSYNEDKSPGYALPRPPCCTWNVDTIGWYWTANETLFLESIQTKLADIDTGYDNGFHMTVQVFTDRPAAGGVELARFRFDAAHFLPGYVPWRGGFFETPLLVNAGTRYFVGMSGWINDRYSNNGRGGINWIIDGFSGPLPAGAEFPGDGTSYNGAAWENLMGTNTVTSAPVLQFVGSPVPLPAAFWLFAWGLVGLVGLLGWGKRRFVIPSS